MKQLTIVDGAIHDLCHTDNLEALRGLTAKVTLFYPGIIVVLFFIVNGFCTRLCLLVFDLQYLLTEKVIPLLLYFLLCYSCVCPLH